MSDKTKKNLKSVVCVGVIGLAVLAGAREARATTVEVTEVKIIRGEVVGGRFQEIEEVDELIVGDVFIITTEVTNLGSETEYVLNIYDWDLSPENRVEVIGTSGLCFTYFELQPGESAVLYPFCLGQAFKAEEAGGVTMNIYVKDWLSGNLCQYTFEFTVIPKPAMIYYVDEDANGINDGSSWTDAYNYLQDALITALSGDEIWVAQGIYKPDQGVGITPGDRTATFQLKNGVSIKGGYAGFGELDPNARDIELYETILSGDLNGDDGPDFANNDDNSYHVVLGSTTDETAVLDGFHITAGNAYDTPWHPQSSNPKNCGGGMHNSGGKPTVNKCTFIANAAEENGGGMYNCDYSNPTLVNCTFRRNKVHRFGGGMYNRSGSNPTLTKCTFSSNSSAGWRGGGMYNSGSSPILTNCTFTGNTAYYGGGMSNGNSSPTLTDCTFSANSARYWGGGMYNWRSSPTLINCIFSGNSSQRGGGMVNEEFSHPAIINCVITNNAANQGGGIYCSGSSPTITNCTFSGNSASRYGGGMYNHYVNNPILLTGCTFAGNSALNGNALACDSYYGAPGYPQATNCILWDGEDGIWNDDGSTIEISYSDVQGGWAGTGNIDVDPCFVEPGYWADVNDPNIIVEPNDPNAVWINGDYHLLEDSPCINAGDPNYVAEPNETDLDGRPRVIGGRIDMGAYEYCPPLPAEVRIVPRSINLASMGKWITCYIRLPEDYEVGDIDPNSVFLEGEIRAELLWVDEEEQVAVARFSRSEVQDILGPGEVELTASGELTDGTVFGGRDIIRVVDKGQRR